MLKYPVVGQSVFSSEATARHELGQLGYDRFGRKFRYARAGASALVVGNAIQAPAQDTDHDQLTPAAAAIGAKVITVTLGAVAVTENQYAGGFAIVDTTPGLGYAYPISGHPAAAISATVALALAPGWEVVVALTTTSRVTLAPNPYRGVIQAPVTTATGKCVGGAVYIIGATEYGWIQSGGPGAALIDGTPAVGNLVTPQAATAGALAIHSGTLPIAAEMMVTGVTGKVLPVFWLID